jgi:hypothetical protein
MIPRQIEHLLKHDHAKVLIVTKDPRQAKVIFNAWRGDAADGAEFWKGYTFRQHWPYIDGPNGRSVSFWSGDKTTVHELGGLQCTNILYTVYDYDTMLVVGSRCRSAEFRGCFSIEPFCWEQL